MSRLLVRQFEPAVAVPLEAAGYCADCEAVFDMRQYRSCPACASWTTVPVSSLIAKVRVAAPTRGVSA